MSQKPELTPVENPLYVAESAKLETLRFKQSNAVNLATGFYYGIRIAIQRTYMPEQMLTPDPANHTPVYLDPQA